MEWVESVFRVISRMRGLRFNARQWDAPLETRCELSVHRRTSAELESSIRTLFPYRSSRSKQAKLIRRMWQAIGISLLGVGLASASPMQYEPARSSTAPVKPIGISLDAAQQVASTNATASGTTTYFGPPYLQVAYMYHGPWPTVSIALQMYWAAYQAVWRMPQCTWPVTYYTPTVSNGGGVAWVDLGNGCGGDGFVVRATQYTYDPVKNNGPPCNCAGDPINLATGNEYRDEEDASLNELSFHRYYNSHASVASSHIGANWRHNFDRSIEYHASSNLSTATVFRPDGRQVVFTLASGQWVADPDVVDRLTEQTNATGMLAGWLYFDAATRNQESYDANGNLLSITDANGLVTTLTYSTASTPADVAPAAGLLLSVNDPRGRVLSFTYNANANVATISEPDGGVLSYGYDASGNLTSVTYPDKTVHQYVYNESTLTSNASLPNAMTGDIDESGKRYTSIGYNAQGQATMSMLASNIDKTQVNYNTDGTTSVTYPTGAQTTLSFVTPYGSLHANAVSAPCGPQCGQPNAAATFDANGYPASTTDFNGNVTKTTYEANGLLDQQIDAAGTTSQRTTNFTWNTTLRVPLIRTVLDAGGNPVSAMQWVYNTAGQTLARCEIDPTNSAASGYTCSNSGTVPAGVRRWTYAYCTAVDTTQCPIVGLMLTATGPRTDTTQTATYSYYLASSAANCGTPGSACYQPGDLHTITDPSGHITTIASYDGAGRITRVTDGNGINTDMTYTPRGWLASRSVGGATTSFTYMPYGAVQTVTDPDGVTTTYGYDAAHRLSKITDAQGNYIQYTLDAAGNKTAEQVYDATGTLHKSLARSFNALGQLTQVMDGLNHTIFDASASNSYDANGNLVQSADGLGVQRQMGYDALNRLAQTIDNYNGAN